MASSSLCSQGFGSPGCLINICQRMSMSMNKNVVVGGFDKYAPGHFQQLVFLRVYPQIWWYRLIV